MQAREACWFAGELTLKYDPFQELNLGNWAFVSSCCVVTGFHARPEADPGLYWATLVLVYPSGAGARAARVVLIARVILCYLQTYL